MRALLLASLALPVGLALACGDTSSSGGDGGSTSGGGGSSGGGAPTGGTGGSGATATGGSAGAAGAGGASGAPHVVLESGELRIDGTPTFLYGGDLHYFRVRAADYDATKTQAMWAESLDLMKAAGMNLVTTYAPWDYHELAAGQWDFGGARDVGKFVQMACERDLWVVFKPGPLITAEWPRGFGTFGAVPAWWKEAHPEALVRNAKGDLYSYSPTGAVDQRQPSYLHPTYLASVKDWYSHVLAQVKPYLGKCLIALQVDNETNLYWSNRFGDVDYNLIALEHYHAFLATKYGSIANLNARYGTSHAAFGAVPPPTSAPGVTSSTQQNPWLADWYWAGQAYSKDYLKTLRQMLEAEGFEQPDVLFFTNDSPFALLFGDLTLRNVLLHDGPTKNESGICGLDLYPKQATTNDELQDQPFQTDFFTRLFDRSADAATGKQAWVYAAELQGGFYSLPALGQPLVRPEATEQILMRSVGRGLKGGAFYVIRDGLNADGSAYDYQAAISATGATTPRYEVMKRWGGFLQKHGVELLRAVEAKNRVAVLTNGAYTAPQGGILDDLQRMTTVEQPALFGWLAAAGFNPEVIDVRTATDAELAEQKVAFYLNPDFQDDATADKLVKYAKAGGVLVTLLWPGRKSDSFSASTASQAFANLYPAADKGLWQWLNAAREGTVNADFAGFKGELESYWYESQWTPSGTATPFLWERTQPLGTNGDPVGWVVDDGGKKRAFIGTYVATRFNQDDYYTLPVAELTRATSLARYLAALGGEKPIVEASGVRHLAWGRHTPGRAFLFVVNDEAVDATLTLTIHDLAALGLSATNQYVATEALRGTALGTHSGSALTKGISVGVPKWSGAVVVLTSS